MIIVIGSGAAGISAALEADRAGERVLLLTKGLLDDCNTVKAQGGIAAAVIDGDDPADLVADTLAAGAGLCDEDAVRLLAREGAEAVAWLLDHDCAFDRRPDGTLAHGLEAAHSFPRILHGGGDATGRVIHEALAASLAGTDIEVVDEAVVLDLLVERPAPGVVWADARSAGRVVGVRVALGGSVHEVAADAVILATGGAGRVFPLTTNPDVATADGVALAWRAGAAIADAEFMQFHPTALDDPEGFLISEAVRGDGAVLRDQDGHRFMPDVDPRAELAPRDIVARGCSEVIARQGGAPVLIDTSTIAVPEGESRDAFMRRRFPTIHARLAEAGIDMATDPIPVKPAAHYWMGGVRTDRDGRTSLPGLYAAGEVARTGVHGANRLASNSLMEAIVWGRRAGRVAAGLDGPCDEWPIWEAVDVAIPSELPTQLIDFPTRKSITRRAWEALGMARSSWTLDGAVTYFAAAARSRDGLLEAFIARGGAQEQMRRLAEDRNIAIAAMIMALAAGGRLESRGAHMRTDHPDTDDALATSTTLRRATPKPTTEIDDTAALADELAAEGATA